MRDKHQAWHHGRDEGPGAGNSLRATPSSGTLALPSWESFPVADRHRLVSAILRAARRQVAGGPASSLPKT